MGLFFCDKPINTAITDWEVVMAKVVGFKAHEGVKKKSSSSGKMSMVKRSSMPKSKKASFKKYRGQGR